MKTDDRIWLPDFNDTVDYAALWDATQHRYGSLATWWIQATEGVNYYRAELPARKLPGKTVRFESRDLQPDNEGNPWFPRQEGEAAVWMFPGNTTRALCMAEMKQQGLRVLVEVDDNYTRQPSIPQMSSWLTKRDRSPQDRHSYEIHCKIVRFADGVIVSTPKLAEVYAPLNEHVYVCPNCVDPDDWDPEPEHAPDGVLRVGWAGSASHAYDLADILPALDWASRQRDVEVVMLGQLVPGLIEHRRVLWTDSLEQYRRNAQQLDVMLCPLRPNPWADCKSDVKALEGVMAGAVPVVSRTEPYRPWWKTEAPCLVAGSRKEFVKAVKHLVANREETAQLAREAREWVLAKRTIEKGVEAWREAVSAS